MEKNNSTVVTMKALSIYRNIILIIFHEGKKFKVVPKIQINVSGVVTKTFAQKVLHD